MKQKTIDFDSLVEANRDRVFNLLFRLTGDYHASEDLFQDTFFRAYRGLDGYDGRASPSTWVTSIALNVFKDHLRKRRRRDTLPLDTVTKGGEPADGRPTPDESFIRNEERRRMQEALNGLGERLKVPVVLYYVEGLTIREIASLTGRSESDIKVSLHRARTILKSKGEAWR